MESLKLQKITGIEGQINLVGSKSLTNRALLLSALAQGTTVLENVLISDDSKHMLNALMQLGVDVEIHGTTVKVQGLSSLFKVNGDKPLELYLGNAGTAMRPLLAALAFSSGKYILTGEPRMMERPIKSLVDSLRELGAKIKYLNNEGFPPLYIEGTTPISNTVFIDGSTSSQYISAILMLAPMLTTELKINLVGDLISKPYVDLTIKLIEFFGAKVKREAYRSFSVASTGYKSPAKYLVEGDASGATYFMAAAAIKGHVKIFGLGKKSIQGDIKFIDVLRQMGAHIDVYDNYIEIFKSKLNGIDVDMNDMPDAAMTLVPMSLFTLSPIKIKNIASWKVKETDRIIAMATEMRKLGVNVEYGEDFIYIDASVRNQEIPCFDTYNDHRMAMCMSLIALDRDIVINDPKCTAKTFPQYFDFLASISIH